MVVEGGGHAHATIEQIEAETIPTRATPELSDGQLVTRQQNSSNVELLSPNDPVAKRLEIEFDDCLRDSSPSRKRSVTTCFSRAKFLSVDLPVKCSSPTDARTRNKLCGGSASSSSVPKGSTLNCLPQPSLAPTRLVATFSSRANVLNIDRAPEGPSCTYVPVRAEPCEQGETPKSSKAIRIAARESVNHSSKINQELLSSICPTLPEQCDGRAASVYDSTDQDTSMPSTAVLGALSSENKCQPHEGSENVKCAATNKLIRGRASLEATCTQRGFTKRTNKVLCTSPKRKAPSTASRRHQLSSQDSILSDANTDPDIARIWSSPMSRIETPPRAGVRVVNPESTESQGHSSTSLSELQLNPVQREDHLSDRRESQCATVADGSGELKTTFEILGPAINKTQEQSTLRSFVAGKSRNRKRGRTGHTRAQNIVNGEQRKSTLCRKRNPKTSLRRRSQPEKNLEKESKSGDLRASDDMSCDKPLDTKTQFSRSRRLTATELNDEFNRIYYPDSIKATSRRVDETTSRTHFQKIGDSAAVDLRDRDTRAICAIKRDPILHHACSRQSSASVQDRTSILHHKSSFAAGEEKLSFLPSTSLGPVAKPRAYRSTLRTRPKNESIPVTYHKGSRQSTSSTNCESLSNGSVSRASDEKCRRLQSQSLCSHAKLRKQGALGSSVKNRPPAIFRSPKRCADSRRGERTSSKLPCKSLRVDDNIMRSPSEHLRYVEKWRESVISDLSAENEHQGARGMQKQNLSSSEKERRCVGCETSSSAKTLSCDMDSCKRISKRDSCVTKGAVKCTTDHASAVGPNAESSCPQPGNSGDVATPVLKRKCDGTLKMEVSTSAAGKRSSAKRNKQIKSRRGLKRKRQVDHGVGRTRKRKKLELRVVKAAAHRRCSLELLPSLCVSG